MSNICTIFINVGTDTTKLVEAMRKYSEAIGIKFEETPKIVEVTPWEPYDELNPFESGPTKKSKSKPWKKKKFYD